MKRLKTFEGFFSNLFKKKSEQKPEISEQKPEISPTAKLVNYLEQDTINYLHDYGYSDANRENIYKNKIYGVLFKNMLEKRLGKNKEVDELIYYLISHITGFEDYVLNKDVNKYNL